MRTKSSEAKLTKQTEASFQKQILDLAKLFGWRRHHTRPSLTQGGKWITAIAGDVGFPDLVLVREDRVIFAELKSETGTVRADQEL